MPEHPRLASIARHLSALRPTAPDKPTPAPAGASDSRPLRIVLGKLQQETNDLNPIPTTIQDFENQGFFHGAAVLTDGREGMIDGFMSTVEGW